MPGCKEFHQSVAAEMFVERKGEPYQSGSGCYPEQDASSLADARHIHHDEKDEYGKQATDEEKEVLCPQPLKLHVTAHSFIDFKLSH